MGGLETAARGDDPYPVRVEVQGGRDAAGSGRHGAADPLEVHSDPLEVDHQRLGQRRVSR